MFCLNEKHYKLAVHLRALFCSFKLIKISLWSSFLAECNFQNRPANSYLFINLDVLELETSETSQMLSLLNFAEQNPFDPGLLPSTSWALISGRALLSKQKADLFMEAFCLLRVESLACSSESLSSLGIVEQECLNQSGSLCFDILALF